MVKKVFYIAVVVVIFIGVMIGANSCSQPDPPKAVVKIIDESGEPVPNAMVIVKAPASDGKNPVIYFLNETKAIADTQWSDDNGKTYYDFKYKAIYRVEVTKDKDRTHPFIRRGIGVLTLEEDKTIEVSIKINEQTVF
jgi:hypothetical protein